MYGCGIGPVLREQHRKLAASVLNASVDVITLREPDSLKELQSMGVTKPEILLTADPALTLPAASEDEIDSVLLRAGIPTTGSTCASLCGIGRALRTRPPCSRRRRNTPMRPTV